MTEPDLAKDDFPQVLFVLGAQKAGTTWLHNVFARNRHAIWVQDQKEVDFWNTHFAPCHRKYARQAKLKFYRAALRTLYGLLPSRHVDFAMRRLHHLALSRPLPEAYEHYTDFLMHRAKSGQIVADISPNYALLSELNLKRLAAFADARFIYILRDPVERAISAVNYGMMEGRSDGETFEIKFSTFLAEGDPHGDYPRILTWMKENVPTERRLFVFYEELFSQNTADRIASFLGGAELRVQPDERVNSSLAFGRPGARDFVKAAERYKYRYDFCEGFFNGALPALWQQNRALFFEKKAV